MNKLRAALQQALRSFLDTEEDEWSPKTLRNYEQSLARHITFLGPDRMVEDIKREDITAWSKSLKDSERGLSSASIARYKREARRFWYWLDEEGYETQSPFQIKISSCTPDPFRVKAIAPQDRRAMLRTAWESGNKRDYAIMRFIADTGCRSGGAYRLQLAYLNLETCEADLLEKGDKSHWVVFTEETAEAIRQWLEVRPAAEHDYVFTALGSGRQMNEDTMRQMFARVAKRAGVTKNYNAHAWRHAVGKHLLRETGDPALVRAKLGHSSVEVTLMYYANKDRDEVRKVTEENTPDPLILKAKQEDAGDDTLSLADDVYETA